MNDPARRAASAWRSGSAALAPLGDGHINDTWLLEDARGTFVLQRLNDAVFPQPRMVAGKAARVAEHLRRDGRVGVSAVIPTSSGEPWHEDAQGGVWRLWEFATGTRTLTRLDSVAQGEAAGAVFGRFQLAVAGLPGGADDSIPGFLQLPHYLAELEAAVEHEPRDASADAALTAIDDRRDLAGILSGRDRLIHGDCKINNLLFRDDGDEVARVIDLDTVMMGNWAWDFGDLARSAAADDRRINVDRFAAIARGFVASGAVAGDSAPEVTDALVLAPRHVALMLAVRFLTDHLRGDRYFKVGARGENLERARRQLDLLEDMERREQAMIAAARRARAGRARAPD